MSAAPILTILRAGQTLKSVPLEGDVSVGRAEGNVIRLEDRAISRKHAIFRSVSEGVQVQKQSEFAPLKVNGAECETALVREGDLIELGPYLVRVAHGIQTGAKLEAIPTSVAAPPLESAPVANTVEASPEVSVGARAAVDRTVDLAPLGASAPRIEAAPAPSLEGPLSPIEGSASPSELSPQASALQLSDPASDPVADWNPGDPLGAQLGGVDTPATDPVPAESAAPGVELGAAPIEGLETPGFEPPGDELGFEQPAPAERTAMIADDAATRVAAPTQLAVHLVFRPGDANTTDFEVGAQEVSIGRGKDCSIVLNDKKSSRKHAIIRRAGVQFTIKDLGSANGTYLNGQRLPANQEQELPGEASLRIGNVSFQFTARSQAYLDQAPELQSPPPEEEAPPAEFQSGAPAPVPELAPAPEFGSPGDPFAQQPTPEMIPVAGAMPTIQGVPADAFAPQGMVGVPGLGPPGPVDKSLLSKFRALPKQRRMLWILILGGALYYGVEEGIITPEMFGFDPPAPPPKVAKKDPNKPDAKMVLTFEMLRPEQKQFVESQHRLAFEYFKNKDYDQALFALEKIFALIPEYKDSKELQTYSREGKRKLEALQEEQRRLEEEQRIKARVATLIEEGTQAMNSKDFERVREVFGEVLTLDPDNAKVAEWKREIEQYEEERRLEASRKQVMAEVNQQAWQRFKAARALTERDKWYAAQRPLREILDLGATDRKLNSATRELLAKAKAWIQEHRDPLLEEALNHEKDGQFSAAYQLFVKAAALDPSDRRAPAGIGRVRGVLRTQAKSLYTEAVLAESYSDFATAKKKYEAVLSTAPKDDEYHGRAMRKLSRFVRLDMENN